MAPARGPQKAPWLAGPFGLSRGNSAERAGPGWTRKKNFCFFLGSSDFWLPLGRPPRYLGACTLSSRSRLSTSRRGANLPVLLQGSYVRYVLCLHVPCGGVASVATLERGSSTDGRLFMVTARTSATLLGYVYVEQQVTTVGLLEDGKAPRVGSPALGQGSPGRPAGACFPSLSLLGPRQPARIARRLVRPLRALATRTLWRGRSRALPRLTAVSRWCVCALGLLLQLRIETGTRSILTGITLHGRCGRSGPPRRLTGRLPWRVWRFPPGSDEPIRGQGAA